MTHSFEKKTLPSGILEIQDEILHNVIGEVCGHFRIILQQMAKDSSLEVPLNTNTEKRIYNNFKHPHAYATGNFHTA